MLRFLRWALMRGLLSTVRTCGNLRAVISNALQMCLGVRVGAARNNTMP